ncbi:MAG: Ig-like domain-containing protein, partial [Firmicutes bacterium]|nr:Ig-like domain-containing protein [Bacillota bacterium]
AGSSVQQVISLPDPVAVTGVSVSPTSLSLEVGQALDLTETVSPSNATIKTVSWSSSNTSVAAVNSGGLVTAVAEGNATITVTTNDGGFTADCAVTVTPGSPVSNVALNMPVTASSEPQSENPASSAVDGNESSRWSATGFPQWIEVDLGEVKRINRTEVVCHNDRAYQFTIECKTTSGGTYTQVVDRSTNTQGGSIANPITDYFTSTDARYVRLTVTGAAVYTGTWTSILEFRVFGNSSNPVAVTGVNVTPTTLSLEEGQTSDLTETVSPSNATDKTVSWSSSNTSVATVNSSGLVTAVAEGSATITVTTNDGGFTANCNVTVTSSSSLTNVALNKSTSQSSTGWGGLAERAVDGNTSGVWSEGSVTHTDVTEPERWWQVDLGQSYTISEIKIWNRTDCCADRLSDYYVFVKNSPFIASTISGLQSESGVTTYHETTQPNPSTSIMVSDLSGQYVRIQKNVNDALSLAEVEVFGVESGGTVNVTGVNVTPTTLSLEEGQTSDLTETVSPSNATDKTVSWSSSNTAIATVSSSGLVTAVAEGNTTITVTTNDGSFTANCAVTVTAAPVTYTLNPTDDSYVRRGTYSSDNYGSSTDMTVKYSSNASYERNTILKFDLSSVSSSVSNATLRLYGTNGGTSSVNVFHTNTDTWSESTVTANDINSTGSALSVTSVTPTAQYYEWDVTSQVATEVGGDKVVSFILKGTTADWISFHSKENTNKPELVINDPLKNARVGGATALLKDVVGVNIYPNPLDKGIIKVGVVMHKSSVIGIRVFNSMGSLVYNEKIGNYEPGRYTFTKDTHVLNMHTSGLYIIEVNTNEVVERKKVILR